MPRRRDKPVIVLTASHQPSRGASQPESTRLPAAYYDAVVRAGGLPLIAPPMRDSADIERLLDLADGVLLAGGRDLPAHLYGAESHPAEKPMTSRRWRFELALARGAVERRLPVLGICLGIQTLNVALGGTLHPHLPEVVPGGERHLAEGLPRAHFVRIVRGSRLARLVGRQRLAVNSTHHQAVRRLGRGLRVVARSEGDRVVEAVEAVDPGHFLLGVQWHPERLFERPEHLGLFVGLVEAAGGLSG